WMDIYYWRDAFGDCEQFQPYLKTLRALSIDGHTNGLQFEKLQGHDDPPLFSIRVNLDTRILLTIYQGKLCLLEVVLNHDYKKSRFVRNPAVLTAFLAKHEQMADAGVATAATATPGWGKVEWNDIAALAPLNRASGEPQALDYQQQRLIEFNGQQNEALGTSLPAIVSGPAGSGKSCVALSLLTKYLREHQEDNTAFPVVYISQSPCLVHEMARLWQEMMFNQAVPGQVLFKTYEQLLDEHLPGAAKPDFVNADFFFAWYRDYVKQAVSGSGGLKRKDQESTMSAELVWREFRIRSGFNADEDYLPLGQRQSAAAGQPARLAICAAYEAYKTHLTSMHKIAPELHPMASASTSTYKLFVVDEAQDFSYGQLRNLNHEAASNIIYFLGDHQVLFDGKSRLNYLQQLFYGAQPAVNVLTLPATYRCSEPVSAVANALIALKYQVTGGAADKLESATLQVAKDSQFKAGDASRISPDNEQQRALLKSAAESPQCAIITLPKYANEAKALFNTPLIFTAKEVKGLEYDTVILWRLLSCKDAKKIADKLGDNDAQASAGHRAKAGHSDESFVPYLNELITAVTRARRKLVIAQDNEHQIKAIISALDKSLVTAAAVEEKKEQPAAPQDWLLEAKKLITSGHHQQAREIFLKKLQRSDFNEFVESLSQTLVADTKKTPAKIASNDSAAAGNASLVLPAAATKSLALTPGGSASPAIAEKKEPWEQELKVLQQLLTSKNPKRGELSKLIKALENDGKDGIEHTFLYFLAKQKPSALLQLAQEQPLYFNKIPANTWALSINDGPEKSLSILFLLATTPLGLNPLKKLVDNYPDVVRSIPGGAWGAAQQYIAPGTSIIYHLAKTEDGHDLLQTLITLVGDKILATAWLQGPDAEKEPQTAALSLLANSVSGQKVLALLLKKHPEIPTQIPAGARYDVNKPIQSNNKRPVHIAAYMGYSEVIVALHGAGANLDLAMNGGITAAYLAAQMDQAKVITALHAAGANLNLADSDGSTPAHIAARMGSHQAIAALHSAGANLDKQRHDGGTPLHVAAKNGHVKVIVALHNAGVNFNPLCNSKATPAILAATYGHTQAIVALHNANANLDLAENKGVTAAFAAAQNGHTQVILALHSANANLDLATNDGSTAAFVAAQNGHAQVIVALHSANANLNLATNDGSTAAFVAAQNGHTQVILALQSANANLNLTTNDGATLAIIAAQNGHADVIVALHSAGINLSQAVGNGVTPAYIAAQNGHVRVINALCSTNAELNQPDHNGVTPVAVAKRHGHTAVVKILQRANADCTRSTTKATKAYCNEPKMTAKERANNGANIRFFEASQPHLLGTISLQQPGWNCFDTALGINRANLVKYALNQRDSLDFRQLLAPEIRSAMAVTITVMNAQRAGNDFGEAYEAQIQLALPPSMHTPTLQVLGERYTQAVASKKFVSACRACGEAIGDNRPSVDSLLAFFTDLEKQHQYQAAYDAFIAKYEPIEKDLQAYSLDKAIYSQYLTDYYAKKNWIAFQPDLPTSIVDIAARMLDSVIVIYEPLEASDWKESYKTKNSDMSKNTLLLLYVHTERYFVALPNLHDAATKEEQPHRAMASN
ncbi:MAG: ankyrin repeat domain-containing protein, partial [Legionellales bacterium]